MLWCRVGVVGRLPVVGGGVLRLVFIGGVVGKGCLSDVLDIGVCLPCLFVVVAPAISQPRFPLDTWDF